MALVQCNTQRSLLSILAFSRSTPVPEKRHPIWGQSAACLHKKVNLIIIFLILSDHLLFPHSLVSFRFWSQTTSKVLYFPSNRSDSEKKKSREREQAPGSGRPWYWFGKRRKGRELHRHKWSASTSLPPPSLPPKRKDSLLMATAPHPSIFSPSLHTDFHYKQLAGDAVGKHLLLHAADSSVNGGSS